jgi:hypothetical protein
VLQHENSSQPTRSELAIGPNSRGDRPPVRLGGRAPTSVSRSEPREWRDRCSSTSTSTRLASARRPTSSGSRVAVRRGRGTRTGSRPSGYWRSRRGRPSSTRTRTPHRRARRATRFGPPPKRRGHGRCRSRLPRQRSPPSPRSSPPTHRPSRPETRSPCPRWGQSDRHRRLERRRGSRRRHPRRVPGVVGPTNPRRGEHHAPRWPLPRLGVAMRPSRPAVAAGAPRRPPAVRKAAGDVRSRRRRLPRATAEPRSEPTGDGAARSESLAAEAADVAGAVGEGRVPAPSSVVAALRRKAGLDLSPQPRAGVGGAIQKRKGATTSPPSSRAAASFRFPVGTAG